MAAVILLCVQPELRLSFVVVSPVNGSAAGHVLDGEGAEGDGEEEEVERERARRLSELTQTPQTAKGVRAQRALSTDQELELRADEEIVDIAVTERRRSIVAKRPTEGDLAIKVHFTAWRRGAAAQDKFNSNFNNLDKLEVHSVNMSPNAGMTLLRPKFRSIYSIFF